MFAKITAFLTSLILPLVSLFTPAPVPTNYDIQEALLKAKLGQLERLGATIPTPVADFRTSLASGISDTDTSMTLVSTQTSDGTNLVSGKSYGFVIENGTANKEYVIGTMGATSTVTGLIRGVSVVTGLTEISSLKKSHRRGASVEIATAPIIQVLARILNGDETIPNALQYDSSVTTSTLSTNSYYLASVGYVNDISFAGAPDASYTSKGIVEIATTSELGNGAADGSGDTSAPLVPHAASFASSSPGSQVAVVTDSQGLIDTSFINQSSTYNWTGAHTFNATTTLAGNTSSTGDITFTGSAYFSSLPTATTTSPTLNSELTTKQYVDSQVGTIVAPATSFASGTDTSSPSGEETVASTTVSAQDFGSNDVLRIWWAAKEQTYLSGDETPTMKIYIGGTPVYSATFSQNESRTGFLSFIAKDSTSSNAVFGFDASGKVTMNASLSVNTSSDFDVYITASWNTGGIAPDQLSAYLWVERMKRK